MIFVTNHCFISIPGLTFTLSNKLNFLYAFRFNHIIFVLDYHKLQIRTCIFRFLAKTSNNIDFIFIPSYRWWYFYHHSSQQYYVRIIEIRIGGHLCQFACKTKVNVKIIGAWHDKMSRKFSSIVVFRFSTSDLYVFTALKSCLKTMVRKSFLKQRHH